MSHRRSSGLTVAGEPDWPALATPESEASGLAGVLVARTAGHNRVKAAGFLVDVYCLGVKNAWPPTEMTASRLPEYTDKFFFSFSGRHLPAPRNWPGIWCTGRSITHAA